MAEGRNDPPLPGVLDRRVTYLLARVANACGQEANAALAALGLDTRHYAVLSLLDSGGAPSQRTIADTLRIDRATVVALADDLERHCLVQRVRSSEDRRANTLQLTTEGHAALQQAHVLMDECEQTFMGVLSRAEQQRLARALERLLSASA